MLKQLRSFLSHPLTRGMNVDDAKTTELRREIICTKPFLHKIYENWYGLILNRLPAGDGGVLELGSGAGFLDSLIPELISSEVFLCLHVKIVLDGRKLPFSDQSLKAIVMTDVLHHIPDVSRFFAEASRCLKPGGAS